MLPGLERSDAVMDEARGIAPRRDVTDFGRERHAGDSVTFIRSKGRQGLNDAHSVHNADSGRVADNPGAIRLTTSKILIYRAW